MTLENGYMPADLLREVEPGMYLEAATAEAYLRAKTASGGILKIASPVGAYRSYAVQVDMHAHPENYGLDPASSVSLAAPGHSSHGLGTRVDIAVGAGRTWAIVRMADFGFKREFGTLDPGHFQFLSPSFASVDVTPIQGVKLPALIRIPNGSIGFVSDAGELDAIGSQAEIDALKATKIVGDWIDFPDTAVWDALTARTARLRGTSTGGPSLAEIQALIPTAAQNGAAAREAIVK